MADEMNKEEIRTALLAEIRAAEPEFAARDNIARAIELASNDELRRYLQMAKLWSELGHRIQARHEDAEEVEVPEITDESAGDPDRYPFWQEVDAGSVAGRSIVSHGYAIDHPEHTFVLASAMIRGYHGPAWVPFNLYSQSQYGVGGGQREESLIRDCAEKLIEAPCAANLWSAIGKRYRHPGAADTIAHNLPARCAEFRDIWQSIRRLAPKEHAESCHRLAVRARQLATEFVHFLADANREDGEGLTFMRLLTKDERERAYEMVHDHNFVLRNRALNSAGVRARDWDEYVGDFNPERPSSELNPPPGHGDAGRTWELIDAVVPPVPSMLERLAGYFDEQAGLPPLTRPNLNNGERNYFAGKLCTYFWTELGDVSPSIVASIVTIFYPQGMSDDEVTQMARKIKAANPLPAG